MTTDFTVQSLTPKKAWQLLQENPKAVLIDVRSSMEFLFVGHPLNAVHVAWIDEPDWDINPHFSEMVYKVVLNKLTSTQIQQEEVKNIPILLICRSGVRSLDAGQALCEQGFSQIYNVLEGFEGPRDAKNHRGTLGGWRFYGLPWEQC